MQKEAREKNMTYHQTEFVKSHCQKSQGMLRKCIKNKNPLLNQHTKKLQAERVSSITGVRIYHCYDTLAMIFQRTSLLFWGPYSSRVDRSCRTDFMMQESLFSDNHTTKSALIQSVQGLYETMLQKVDDQASGY